MPGPVSGRSGGSVPLLVSGSRAVAQREASAFGRRAALGAQTADRSGVQDGAVAADLPVCAAEPSQSHSSARSPQPLVQRALPGAARAFPGCGMRESTARRFECSPATAGTLRRSGPTARPVRGGGAVHLGHVSGARSSRQAARRGEACPAVPGLTRSAREPPLTSRLHHSPQPLNLGKRLLPTCHA